MCFGWIQCHLTCCCLHWWHCHSQMPAYGFQPYELTTPHVVSNTSHNIVAICALAFCSSSTSLQVGQMKGELLAPPSWHYCQTLTSCRFSLSCWTCCYQNDDCSEHCWHRWWFPRYWLLFKDCWVLSPSSNDPYLSLLAFLSCHNLV
jgi:hypothetical protein